MYAGALHCLGFPLVMQRRVVNIGILHCSLTTMLPHGSVACRHAISQPVKVYSLHYHTQPTATEKCGTDLKRHSPCTPASSALMAFCRSHLVISRQFRCPYLAVPSFSSLPSAYILNLNPTQFSAMLCVSNLNPSPFSTVFVRGYIIRAITIALKKRQKKITIPKIMQIIDEEGNNLGDMSSEIVLKLAESRNLSLSEVRKPNEGALAVYRLYTRKQRLEQDKRKKVVNKKDPKNVTKDITITTRIGQHDLDVKIAHMKKFLEKQHAVRVFVQTRYTRGMKEEEEQAARSDLVKNIEKQLEGLGTKMREDRHGNRGMVCIFKSNL